MNKFHGHGKRTQTTVGDYMRARHYKYMLGRFQTPDPVNGSISSPQSWNLYSYVENDPINCTDPYGLLRVQVEAGTPLNLEYAIKDINAWEMFQHMQILLMFQKNEILYYLDAKARETGSVIICYDTGCAEYVTVQAAEARVPSYNFLVEGSIADWWHKFYTGFYFGTGYGQKALNYYADILADPQSTFAERVVAAAGGFMSSLWLPNTYLSTSLGIAGITAADAAFSEKGLKLFGKYIIKIGKSVHGRWPKIGIRLKNIDIYIRGKSKFIEWRFK